MKMKDLIVSFYTKLINLNLFSLWNFGSKVNRQTGEHLGQWSTRLYLILICIGVGLLSLYTIILPQTLTKTFDIYSLNNSIHLKQIYGNKLKCPCSTIASKYQYFVHIEPRFHQVSEELISFVLNCCLRFVRVNW